MTIDNLYNSLKYRIVKYEDHIEYYDAEGRLHRLDGPAVEYYSNIEVDIPGPKAWYKHGLFHRTDGPAIEYSNGDVEYWVDGLKYSQAGFNIRVKYRETD